MSNSFLVGPDPRPCRSLACVVRHVVLIFVSPLLLIVYVYFVFVSYLLLIVYVYFVYPCTTVSALNQVVDLRSLWAPPNIGLIFQICPLFWPATSHLLVPVRPGKSHSRDHERLFHCTLLHCLRNTSADNL